MSLFMFVYYGFNSWVKWWSFDGIHVVDGRSHVQYLVHHILVLRNMKINICTSVIPHSQMTQ